jgi:hypothetical protein
MRLKYDNVNENYLHDASQSESFEKPPFLSFRPNVLRIGRGPVTVTTGNCWASDIILFDSVLSNMLNY